MLCRLPFSKSFKSDNHVYSDLNNSTLDFFYLVSSKSFLDFEIVVVVIVRLFYDAIRQVDYWKSRQIQANWVIIKDIMQVSISS